MFSSFSSFKKGVFVKKAFSFFFALCLVMGAALFTGCDLDGDEVRVAELSGNWISAGGDHFIVDTTNNTFSYWFGTEPSYGDGSMDYKGNIVGEVLADKTLLQSKYGYLTIQITYAGEYGPTVGKYFVIHWKELTPSAVEEAGAYKEGGNNNGMDSIAEAEAEYTVDNGYFGMFGAYSKE
ncbi:MAG: hypothetical protein LBQ88_17165 [Treponema sp.]|jgi:hypothetical protein|nr:hypothetical protein [Treponema sp.]